MAGFAGDSGENSRTKVQNVGVDSTEHAGINELINGTVEVLDAAVNKEGWLLVDQPTRGVKQEFGRDAWIKRRGHLPREYAA